MSCIYHCESLWLPLDGGEDEHDSVILDEGEGPYEYLPLLLATQFIPCPLCNIESMNNLVGAITDGRCSEANRS